MGMGSSSQKMNLLFEITTSCNAKCIFCPRYEMTRPMGQMSEELFHKIIKEGKEIGIGDFYPYLNGESFTFPKIYEWLDYMEKEGVSVVLYTNAELIDVDRLVKYKNIKSINCSLNAATKEICDKVMRGVDFEKANKNARDLIDKAPFKVTVSFVINEENFKEVDLFRKKWGNKAVVTGYCNWGGARKSFNEKKEISKYCRRTSYAVPVLWDGRVNLCCMDYDGKMIFGDLNKESLKDIMEKRQDIRKKHWEHDFSMIPCKDCNFSTINRCKIP